MPAPNARRQTNEAQDIAHTLGRIEGWMEQTDKRLDRWQAEVIERIAQHDTSSRQGLNDLRQDVVAANTDIRRKAANHESRIWGLENDKAMRSGALKLVDWLKEYSPWAVAALVGLLAYLK